MHMRCIVSTKHWAFIAEDAPQITPPEQTVDEGDPVTIRCWVEGNPTAELSFVRSDDKPLPFGHAVSRGILSIPAATMEDAGSYVCIYHPKLHHPNEVDQAPPPQRTTPSILHVVARMLFDLQWFNHAFYDPSGKCIRRYQARSVNQDSW